MGGAGHSTRFARSAGTVAGLASLAVLLAAAPRAAGGPEASGHPVAAALGSDIEGLAFDAAGR
jgi:hypothetical protein